MDGKELLAHIAALKDNLQKYLETKISYYGIVAFEKAAKVLSLCISNIMVLMAALLALLFLSGAAAVYLGGVTGSYGLGMLMVGGFYLLLLCIFYFGRRRIFGRAAIRILRNIFLSDEDEGKKK